VKPHHGYESPAAFRRALTDKLRVLAAESRWPLPQLQRQIAYDRLLERLHHADDQWIVKGATALLARGLGVRTTIDIDLYRPEPRPAAEARLREAAKRDIGDWFRFELGPSHPAAEEAISVRLPATAVVGTTVWVSFQVDLAGEGLRITGQPDRVPPLAAVYMPDIEQHGYRAYPLADHVADKLAATFDRYGELRAPSTRYRDLVDLVAILTGTTVAAGPQLAALASEADRRGITLPRRFAAPDPRLWESGYRAEAQRSLLTVAHSLDEALAIVCPFADPLLDGSATGTWDPDSRRWSG
jgi:Nucleotidyl transferase AbiEii toxin, Type IV TA system